jgi:hypothetical protein
VYLVHDGRGTNYEHTNQQPTPGMGDATLVEKKNNGEWCCHGVYLGHSTNMPAMLQLFTTYILWTGLISPAFHIVFDDEFTSGLNANPTGKLQDWSLD